MGTMSFSSQSPDHPPVNGSDLADDDFKPVGNQDVQPPQPRKRTGGLIAGALGVAGEIFLTLGVILALFIVYQVYWTDVTSGRKQQQAADELSATWASQNPTLGTETELAPDEQRRRQQSVRSEEGTPFARMYIPAFGSDYTFAIISGATPANLEVGPAHYYQTQLPGQAGNFAVAGHRVGRGAPFNDLDALNSCDAIVVETQFQWHVYRVLPIDAADEQQRSEQARQCLSEPVSERLNDDEYFPVVGRQIVNPDEAGALVLNPLPSTTVGLREDMLPLLTLTTCHPQYSDAQRMIIHGVHVRSEDKTPGQQPIELQG